MNKQILKLLWNRRKDYIWIFLEQVLVSIVLLFCFIQVSTAFQQYHHLGNLSLENVYSIGIVPNNSDMTNEDREVYNQKYSAIFERIKANDAVEVLHGGYYSIPHNRPSSNNFQDSLVYNGQKYKFFIKTSDDNFQRVFKPHILEGTWYKDEIFEDGVYPAIVTETLVKKLDIKTPIGARFSYDGRDFRVTGVIPDFKTFVYDNATPTAILATSAFKDTKFDRNIEHAVLVKERRGDEFANFFWKEVATEFPNEGHQPYSYNLGDATKNSTKDIYLIFLIIAIPVTFLIVFAFLGTFSLMYRLSQKSIGEYGLRIALGSTKNGLRKMVFWQSCLLTATAIVVGGLIGLNIYLVAFPEVEFLIFFISLIIITILMLLFALISVWHPAYKASKTQPAIALKQDE